VSENYEFGSKDAADAFRDEYADYVCPIDDDKRLKTVAVVSDAPDWLHDRASVGAGAGRAEHGGPGQVELTKTEKNRLGPFTGSNNILKARSAKAIFLDHGVDDWTSYYDPDLTVDEHRELAERAREEGGGRRLDAEDDAADHLDRAEAAMGEECEHARDHCEHGDPDACEFLHDACGMSDDEVAAILDDQEGDPAKGDLPGPVYGALKRLWTQYNAGLSNAKQAAGGINEIRVQYGQDAMAFEELGDRTITRDTLS